MKNIKIIWGIILLLALSCRQSPEKIPLNIMSFNIRLNIASDGDNAWPHRKELAASMVRFHDADIVGCQEAMADQVQDLDNLLPDYGWVGVGRDDGKSAGEYSVVFYKKDRFQVDHDSTFWLSPTPEKPGYAWGAHYNRIVTLAKFKDLKTGSEFFFFNTHFDHESTIARKESALLILRTINSITGDLPVILTGDFNCPPSSVPYQILTSDTKTGLRDTKTISLYPHHGPFGSWSGFTSAYYPDSEGPIDHIFVNKGATVLRHATLSDSFDGKFPSDHMPVLAQIVLSASKQ